MTRYIIEERERETSRFEKLVIHGYNIPTERERSILATVRYFKMTSNWPGYVIIEIASDWREQRTKRGSLYDNN